MTIAIYLGNTTFYTNFPKSSISPLSKYYTSNLQNADHTRAAQCRYCVALLMLSERLVRTISTFTRITKSRPCIYLSTNVRRT